MKKILVFLICFSCLIFTSCKSNDTITVSVEIDCSEILSHYDDLDSSLKDEKYVPSDGKILKKTSVTVNKDAVALDVLKQVANDNNIQIDVSKGYAKSINYLYEKSCGEMSGWVYEINNEMVFDEGTLENGDLLTWKFVCSFE